MVISMGIDAAKNGTGTFLTPREVGGILGASATVVTRLANSGTLPYLKIGTHKVFEDQSVRDYLVKANLTPAPVNHARAGSNPYEIKGLSFFSGAGGLDLGMERAGIPSLLYVENNRECRMTLMRNRPDTGLLGDVSSVDASTVLKAAGLPDDADVDVMFGGPPCQAFSTAGARRAFNDERGNIFLKYLDLAAEIRPRYLIIENVRGLLSTPFPVKNGGPSVRGGAMRLVLNRLRQMKYKVSFNLYNSANYSAPQLRERVVIIAKRDGKRAHWMVPTNSNDPQWGLPRWKTFNQAVAQIEDSDQHYVQFPKKRLQYFQMLHEGENWTSLPKEMQPKALGKAYVLGGGKTGFYRRLDGNKPSPTLVTSPTMPATDLCHPTLNRPLSVEEYKAIQGFPADWYLAGDITSVYRQIGNAVPIQLGEAIGKTIISDMQDSAYESRWETFKYSRYTHTNEKTWKLG